MTDSTVAFLRERITRAPRALLILGSGLGAVAERIEDALEIPYATIPGFPRTGVAGHAGTLTVGILEGVEVVAMSGRFHLYEGWGLEEVSLPLRAFAALGVDRLLVTNAAGGIRPDLCPGELMLIRDHLNLMFRSPPDQWSSRADPELSPMYDPELRTAAHEVAAEIGMELKEGVYAAVRGPSYETPAEIRMLARLGADAVGMSTVPEVIAARTLGVRVVGISCITNFAAGLGGGKLSHAEVLDAGARASGRLEALVRSLLPRIAPSNLPTEAAS